MAPKSSTLSSLLLLSFLLLSSSVAAHNITRILGQSKEFSKFNSFLTQTQLADEINRRQTITVLAVADDAFSAVSGQPIEVVKSVLSLHVVLDYFDADKLHKLSNNTALLTTLFQTTGQASGQMGFLNVTDTSDGLVALGSAVAGAGLTAKLVKSVAAQPYNISVLQISSVIVPPGIGNSNHTSPPASPPPPTAAPEKAPTPATTPAAAPPKPSSPAASPSNTSPVPSGVSPTPSDDSSPPPAGAESPAGSTAPAKAPASSSPSPSDDSSDSPASDAPLSSPPSPTVADGPTSDGAEGPGPAADQGSSGATRVAVGAGFAVVVGAVFLGAL